MLTEILVSQSVSIAYDLLKHIVKDFNFELISRRQIQLNKLENISKKLKKELA